MEKVFTIIVAGQAGHGVRKAGIVISKMFRDMGLNVFQMDDYPSLIKGGHNFVVVSASSKRLLSHYMKADIVVALDERSYHIHKEHMVEKGIIVFDDSFKGEGIALPIIREAKKYSSSLNISGVSAVAILSAAIGTNKDDLSEIIKKEYPRNAEENVGYALAIYKLAKDKVRLDLPLKKKRKGCSLLTGNEAIALGMAGAGLDIYFAYPMTPSTSILHLLSKHSNELGIVVTQPENEIAVANMAIGAAFAGARVAVGTSGGGFALMEEAFSLAGMVEAPVFFVLSSRPGPSTGVPTYTEQADLLFAIHQGHGEFPRIVASPGSIEEAFYLAGELLDLAWRFQTPSILLTEKHLSESRLSVSLDVSKVQEAIPIGHKKGKYKRYLITEDGVSPLLFPPSGEVIKWNSYEHDEMGITTEDVEMIAKMHNKRLKKREAIVEYMKGMRTVNEYGEGDEVIFTFGSTTMSVLEALDYADITARVVQPIYLEPFPIWELRKYKRGIVVEQNSRGQLAELLREKAGVEITSTIKRYDGRPFDVIELSSKIKGCL